MGEKREATVILTDEKIHFQSSLRSYPSIEIDYPAPIGTGNGYTSLELFLISLGSCSGSSVAVILRKMNKNVAGLKVHASGIRRDTHPTSFESIHLTFTITSDNADDASVKRAIAVSEESLCPVWAMIKNSVTVTTEFTIKQNVNENINV
jgi:putative redox protein